MLPIFFMSIIHLHLNLEFIAMLPRTGPPFIPHLLASTVYPSQPSGHQPIKLFSPASGCRESCQFLLSDVTQVYFSLYVSTATILLRCYLPRCFLWLGNTDYWYNIYLHLPFLFQSIIYHAAISSFLKCHFLCFASVTVFSRHLHPHLNNNTNQLSTY